MPIRDPNDAKEVHGSFDRIFDTALANRANVVRRLFVEVLDFERHTGTVSLRAAPKNVKLPDSAEFVARLDGFYVLYMHLSGVETDRVRRAEVQAAARLIEAQIGEDILLVVSNRSGSQLHIILPDFSGSQSIILRRMVVTKGVPRRTVVQQIANIYVEYRTNGNLRKTLSDAFDVEEVTRDFFEKYKEIFDRALVAITGFGNDEESKRRFTQTLFNRLMFVHFLSRKARTGWLSINGNTDYLRALWDDFRAKATPLPSGNMPTFYDERLKLLFFTGLNNPDSRDPKGGPSSLIGTVPFLNGGLFEEGEYDRPDSPIAVPDSVIEAALTDLFERFNFTVMESTPFDIEVAVDPEMLGKIFEELVNKRHDSGAYYTPRPVVAFMCREALKGYLEGKDTGVGADAIAQFVDSRETDGIGVDAARRIAHALDEITVVDPACGSGAFLLGMMQELVELQTTLYNVGVDPESLYDLKLHIIERNLYGVDIDDFAVNIAMLRLWLSLAIDFDGAKLEPLPNLDFKIVTGDSLLGPDPSPENYGTLFRHQVIGVADKLATLKGEYMKAYDPSYKNEFREGIGRLEQELTQALAEDVTPPPPPTKIVDWRVQFAEVFARNGGFDVAIANPPYGISMKDGRTPLIAQTDSYAHFMALGIDIAPSGVLTFITPTSWETGQGFKGFREYLFSNMALQSLVNLPYDVFASPYVDTAITVGQIGRAASTSFHLATLEKRVELDLTRIAGYMVRTDWSTVAADVDMRVPLLGWAANLFSRIHSKATPLGNMASSKRGIEAYQYGILPEQIPGAMPFFEGQVQRYETRPSDTDSFVIVSDRDVPFHKGPRILTRRIVSRSNRLMSAVAYSDFVVKKDIYVSRLPSDDPRRLSALLAILNSSLMSFLYLSRSAAAVKDDFRQVTLSGLRELPIIFPEANTATALSQLVSARQREEDDIVDLERQIDGIVYRTYGVTEAEQHDIGAWLAQAG